jgi:hypothetical protein
MFHKIFCADFWMVSTALFALAVSPSEAEERSASCALENEHIRLVFDHLGRVMEILNKKTHIHYTQPDGDTDPLPAFIIDAYSANQHIYIHDPLLRESGGFCSADPELLFSTQRSGDLYRLAIEPSQPPELTLTTQNDTQILTCSSVLNGDIRVTFSVSLPPDSATSEWCIAVNDAADVEPRQHLRVYRILFPLLSRLCIDGDPERNFLARPYIQGELIPNPSQYSFSRPNRPQNYINVLSYPGWASMPWMDLYAQDADSANGLYFASCDPAYQQLDMETVPDAEAGSIAMGMRTLAFLEPGQQWRSQKFVLALHSGDWHWAADRYRSDSAEWFIEPDVPEWVKYTHGWFGSGGPNYRFSELPEMLEDARWLGLNYLQCWSEMLENVGPEKSRKPYYCFFLPDPERGGESEMTEGVRSVREQGGHIGFYSNFWTWDADSGRCLEQWKQDIPPDVNIPYWQEFKHYMSVFPDGHMEAGNFLEGYAGSCPGAEGWRDYLEFWIIDKYVKQYGVDAWYLDSFPVTMFGAARVCFSQHHGERSPHGVGQWLLEFVKNLRKESEDTVQLAITCESTNDLFMQYNSHALGLELIEGITQYPKPEIYTYTFPHHPIFSGSCNGAGSGLKYYYPDVGERGSRQDTLNRVFLMGYRFDILGHKLNRDNPDMIYIRDLIALRNSIKDELYNSSFKDEVGLGKLPQNVWAKIFRHDQGQSLTVAFIDRRKSKDAMSLTVDASRLDVGCMSKAMLHTLDGRQTELKINVRADGVLVIEIPGRKGDAAAVIMQEGFPKM